MINSPQYREFAGFVAAIFWMIKTHSDQLDSVEISPEAVAFQDNFNRACVANRNLSNIYISTISEFIKPPVAIQLPPAYFNRCRELFERASMGETFSGIYLREVFNSDEYDLSDKTGKFSFRAFCRDIVQALIDNNAPMVFSLLLKIRLIDAPDDQVRTLENNLCRDMLTFITQYMNNAPLIIL